MYNTDVRVQLRQPTSIAALLERYDLSNAPRFSTLEEETEVISGIFLGTSTLVPVVDGVIGYHGNPKDLTIDYDWIIGKKRLHALWRYINDAFALTDCPFLDNASQKAFYELPEYAQRQLLNTTIPWFTIAWASRHNALLFN